MADIRQADIDADRPLIRELFREYLEWVLARLSEEYGITVDVESPLEQSMAMLDEFVPPHGRLLLASEGTRAAGIACMRRLRDDIVEIKRMYVRPEFRGKGIGRAMLDALLADAWEMGHTTVRLDSGRFMEAAQALYRSAGFHEIKSYAESEVPLELRKYWVYMERHLKRYPSTTICSHRLATKGEQNVRVLY